MLNSWMLMVSSVSNLRFCGVGIRQPPQLTVQLAVQRGSYTFNVIYVKSLAIVSLLIHKRWCSCFYPSNQQRDLSQYNAGWKLCVSYKRCQPWLGSDKLACQAMIRGPPGLTTQCERLARNIQHLENASLDRRLFFHDLATLTSRELAVQHDTTKGEQIRSMQRNGDDLCQQPTTLINVG